MATEVLVKTADVKPEEPVTTELTPVEITPIGNHGHDGSDNDKEAGVENGISVNESVGQSVENIVESAIMTNTTLANLAVPNTNLNTITIGGTTVPVALASVEGQSISLATPVVSGGQMVTQLPAGYQLLLQQQYLNFLQLHHQSLIQMGANVSIFR